MPHLESWVIVSCGYGSYAAPELRVNILSGWITGHPLVPDDEHAFTSILQDINFESRTARTKNNTYTLGEPDPGWIKWCGENGVDCTKLQRGTMKELEIENVRPVVTALHEVADAIEEGNMAKLKDEIKSDADDTSEMFRRIVDVVESILHKGGSTVVSRLRAENTRLVQALHEIEGQAVCASMDGDAGNAEMLRHIVGVVESTLRRIGSTAASRLADAAPSLLVACEEFIRKVECGEARSVRSYAQMKAAVAKAYPTAAWQVGAAEQCTPSHDARRSPWSL